MQTLIIGAGVAGAAAAHSCEDATVLEAGDRVGGRMATRVHDGVVYDPAAGYVADTGDERAALVREMLGADLAAFDGRIETFDAEGTISPGREDQPTRLTGQHGIRQVPIRLLAGSGADLRTGTAVTGLERTDRGWRAHTDAGTLEPERVVATPTASRTAALLDSDDVLGAALQHEADRVDYRTLDSVVLGYDHPVDRDWYALVDTSREHDACWLARESRKPGRVPEGEAALVVHLSPAWAATRDPAEAPERAARAAANLLDDDRLRAPAWTDHQRYRHARPDHRIEPGVVERAASRDLYLAGDWVAGAGRTFAALQTGLDAGRRATRAAPSAVTR